MGVIAVCDRFWAGFHFRALGGLVGVVHVRDPNL